MSEVLTRPAPACSACRDGAELPFEITMAYQPIVDLSRGRVHAFEALVRGAEGASAGEVLARVTPEIRYAFDQRCRTTAIELASRLGIVETGARLSINFMPGAVYRPEACIRATLAATARTGFPTDRLNFELTEDERVRDPEHLAGIFSEYRKRGFAMALDDFGAGHSGLSLLAELPPDVLKIDRELVRGVDESRTRQAVLRAVVGLCRELGVGIVAEGIEHEAEARCLRGLGIDLQQGYLFARPGFETLPVPRL